MCVNSTKLFYLDTPGHPVVTRLLNQNAPIQYLWMKCFKNKLKRHFKPDMKFSWCIIHITHPRHIQNLFINTYYLPSVLQWIPLIRTTSVLVFFLCLYLIRFSFNFAINKPEFIVFSTFRFNRIIIYHFKRVILITYGPYKRYSLHMNFYWQWHGKTVLAANENWSERFD